MPISSSKVWQWSRPGDLKTAVLGDGCAVFDRRTGDSHYFADPSATAVAALVAGPCSARDLQQLIQERFEIAQSSDLVTYVEEMITQFAQFEFIE